MGLIVFYAYQLMAGDVFAPVGKCSYLVCEIASIFLNFYERKLSLSHPSNILPFAHSWKLPSTTNPCTVGNCNAPVEQIGLKCLAKGHFKS